MSERIVELIRRFAPMSSRSWDLDSLHPGPGKVVRWHEIENERRVLIIADPGAGKTFEATSRARKLRGRGKQAFFVRIERIDAAFATAFEVGTAAEFSDWLASSDEAWFFLDSVDEAQLETPRALEAAVRIFGARIHSALPRTHIFITSREDAWRALPDQTLIEQHLPFGEPPPNGPDSSSTTDSSLKLFRLTGLSDNEIALFAGHHGVSDVTEFIDAVKRGNLLAFAERPFDLKALTRVWNADGKLGSRYEVLERLIHLQLTAQTASPATSKLAVDKARDGARALAGAVMLTGKSLICLPGGSRSPDRIDSSVLLPGWNASDIHSLLHTGLFDDVVYTSVRFRHREIRELLSAEWAYGLMKTPSGRPKVEQLFLRESYGEWVIVPRTRPTLHWLILMDEQIRGNALSIEPEIATEGGDPSRLPLDIRKETLRNLVDRILAGRSD